MSSSKTTASALSVTQLFVHLAHVLTELNEIDEMKSPEDPRRQVLLDLLDRSKCSLECLISTTAALNLQEAKVQLIIAELELEALSTFPECQRQAVLKTHRLVRSALRLVAAEAGEPIDEEAEHSYCRLDRIDFSVRDLAA